MKMLLTVLMILISGCCKSYKFDLPDKPLYQNYVWQKKDGFECLDKNSAKLLLENRALKKGYIKELETIGKACNEVYN